MRTETEAQQREETQTERGMPIVFELNRFIGFDVKDGAFFPTVTAQTKLC